MCRMLGGGRDGAPEGYPGRDVVPYYWRWELNEDGVWGITRKMDLVHFFRGKRTICEGRNHKRGWLFIARPEWVPDAPETCPVCLKQLRLDKIEEQARKKKKMKV